MGSKTARIPSFPDTGTLPFADASFAATGEFDETMSVDSFVRISEDIGALVLRKFIG
jgi:hypothetical protein